MGLSKCYLKQLFFAKDAARTTRKEHHHTGFEIHIMQNGRQIYEVGGQKITLLKNMFVIFPPQTKHRVLETTEAAEKFSITFEGEIAGLSKTAFMGQTPRAVLSALSFVLQEKESEDNRNLIANRIFEAVVLLFRAVGVSTGRCKESPETEDDRVALAKQYIEDNITQALTVSDVAAYCHLSTKQLTRLFLKIEDAAPAAYIRKKRISHIEHLLSDSQFSLKSISEQMHFESEYHFNSFFKKYAGLPPGEYRKTLKK